MYWLVEAWTFGVCNTSVALDKSQAKHIARSVRDEHLAICEAGGLLPDVLITLHQCRSRIDFCGINAVDNRKGD